MKKLMKIGVLLLAAFMLVSSFAGCGNAGTAGDDEKTVQKTGTTADETQKEVLPTELIVSSFNWGWPTVEEKTDRIGPALEKALGFKVKLNVIKVGSSDEADKKLQLWAATGAEDMPDILMTTSSNNAKQTIKSLGDNGMLLDWQEILDKMPTYKAQVSHLLPLCSDIDNKKLYKVPQNYGSVKGGKTGATPLIRKDWLDKLGLSVPKTTDELYNVLKAFKEKIKLPDGKPVIPMAAFGETFWNDKYMFDNPKLELASSGQVTFGMNDWFTDTDGKVKRHDMVFTDNLIGFLSFYNKLYNEGLLDKECFTLKYGQWEEKLSSGRVGSYSTWGSHVQKINDALAAADKDAYFVGCNVFDTKFNPDLDVTNRKKGGLGVASYWIVKKDIPQDQLNGMIKYFEYTMGDEGFKLSYYGQEGVDWELDANGKIVDTKESIAKFEGNLGKKIVEGIWYYSVTPNFDLILKYYAPTAYDTRRDNVETWKNLGYEYGEGYATEKAMYVEPGPIEQQKGAGYVDRWKDMVVKSITAKSVDQIKEIVQKWQDTERKLGYEEISAERTERLKTVPDLNYKYN